MSKNDAISIGNNSNLNERSRLSESFFLAQMQEKKSSYYRKNKERLLEKAKQCYENNKERLQEQAKNKYRELSNEKKDKK